MRRKEQVNHIKENGNNPSYLPQVQLNPLFVFPSDNLELVIAQSRIIIFAVPSTSLKQVCDDLDYSLFDNKLVLAAMKGTVGANNEVPSSFLNQTLKLPESHIATISGHCHPEEIADSKPTYLTLSCSNQDTIDKIAVLFRRPYVKVISNYDPIGVGYASIYKNVLGKASGIAKGLGYWGNFLAVLLRNALFEMQNVLRTKKYGQREILNSSYAGDLLVTGYSNNSRNRRFGEFIAQGHSAEGALNKLGMVAEGYWATRGLFCYAKEQGLVLPIFESNYEILYGNHSVRSKFKKLERKLK